MNDKNLNIYKQINEYMENEVVVPYEDKYLLFLATHTDKENSCLTNNFFLLYNQLIVLKNVLDSVDT